MLVVVVVAMIAGLCRWNFGVVLFAAWFLSYPALIVGAIALQHRLFRLSIAWVIFVMAVLIAIAGLSQWNSGIVLLVGWILAYLASIMIVGLIVRRLNRLYDQQYGASVLIQSMFVPLVSVLVPLHMLKTLAICDQLFGILEGID